MGKNKQNNPKRGTNRFFRWIRSDLPDDHEKKPVLLLGVSKITDSPFARRRSSDGAHTTGSIKFFRPPKPKYTRGIQADERLEKIRQDLLTHQNGEVYIPNDRRESSCDTAREDCKLNCIGNCVCKRTDSSNRGSFSFHRSDQNNEDIEFKYTEHVPDAQPCSSKTSYNVTPKSTDRRSLLLSNLNERFRKTLSLDSRKVETNRLSIAQEQRPKSLVNTSNIIVAADPLLNQNFSKATQPKKKRRSFFSLETFFDKKSDCSSIDDYCSSKYKRFEFEDSPLLKRPDLLNLPVIIDSVRKSDTKRHLEKLESHYYKNINHSLNRRIVDAVPKDATEGPSGITNNYYVDDEVEYIEPIRSNFTSQSTLILDKNIPKDQISINTDETDIKLPSSPKFDDDSIGQFEIEVKESDLHQRRNLTVKVMDKSIDSIGSCSLDVDASTDFSDTTSGSLNLLTPSSTTSRVRDFTAKLHERAHLAPDAPTPSATPARTPELTPTPRNRNDHLLKPPPKVIVDTSSHRSRAKKREEFKKPSYLNLACSVNGYSNLTTYDSKLRQDINKSREASPIRPITHTYQYRTETNSLLVPVPVSANKLIVPTFQPHDSVDLTVKAPSKAHTDPYLATSPVHVFMAEENKQLKKDFFSPNMAATTRPYMSSESKNFAASMLQDEIDNAKEITFKSSYSETNFRKTSNGSKVDTRISSESYTINSNGVSKRVEITKENGEILTSPMKSFIQQRVERLYGPGALAQGFFNQRRYKLRSQSEDDEKLKLNTSIDSIQDSISSDDPNVSLPVLRHLRPEFRAQLPIVSPKKSPRNDSLTEKKIPVEVKILDFDVESVANGVSVIKVDSKVNGVNGASVNGASVNGASVNGASVNGESVNGESVSGECVKDGHYFLVLEKKETERLLAMSAYAEKELESLQDKENISEEVLGLLRSAAGKARLLATQKMRQFEGLCYNNINDPAGIPFPTTAEDLQGFWDMVRLQVDNVDALYAGVEELKANGWQEIITPKKSQPPSTPTTVPRATRRSTPAQNEKSRLAAEKREADRKAMLEHRRRVARERQMAARAGPSTEQQDMGIEGSQEVEIFVGKTAKPTKVAPKGDCKSANHSEDSIEDQS